MQYDDECKRFDGFTTTKMFFFQNIKDSFNIVNSNHSQVCCTFDHVNPHPILCINLKQLLLFKALFLGNGGLC